MRLTGASFEDVYLDGARLHDVDLRGASLRMVDLRGLRARDVWLEDVDITGDVENVRINGVDVAPLIEAELDRRDPDRPKMRPTDAAGYREAWDVVERLWAGTVERARTLPTRARCTSGSTASGRSSRPCATSSSPPTRGCAGPSSATPSRGTPLDLPHDDMPDSPPVPRDRDVRPSLDEVLALRADRMATVRRVVDGLTDETSPARPSRSRAGLPEPEPYAVTRILRTSSTRSGSTGSTPSATSTPSRPTRARRPSRRPEGVRP